MVLLHGTEALGTVVHLFSQDKGTNPPKNQNKIVVKKNKQKKLHNNRKKKPTLFPHKPLHSHMQACCFLPRGEEEAIKRIKSKGWPSPTLQCWRRTLMTWPPNSSSAVEGEKKNGNGSMLNTGGGLGGKPEIFAQRSSG